MPHVFHEYPNVFEGVECAKELRQMFAAGTLQTKAQAAVNCSYVVLGAGLSVYPGSPNAPNVFGAAGPDGLDDLESECSALSADLGGQSSSHGATADIDPAMIAMILEMIQQVIKWIAAWRNRPKVA